MLKDTARILVTRAATTKPVALSYLERLAVSCACGTVKCASASLHATHWYRQRTGLERVKSCTNARLRTQDSQYSGSFEQEMWHIGTSLAIPFVAMRSFK